MIRACKTCGSKNRLPEDRLDQKAACGKCKTALLPLAEPYEVPSAQAFDDLIGRAPLPVLVDFWAAWCGPCRSVAPEIHKLAGQKAGDLIVAKVDTESLPEVAARYGVRGIPHLILFRNGRPAKSMTGAGSAQVIARELGL